MNTAPTTARSAPRVLRDRYVIQETLGVGGMGVVYKALDQDVVSGHRVGPIQVALKIVNSDKYGGPESVEALKNEGSVVFKLRHKNIVEMYSAERDGATWFLTMELLEGETFEAIIARYPNGVPLPECLPLIAQLCDGISYAYTESKIVHSDLKPSNVFVTRGKIVKIFDFGIASRVRDIGEPETRFDPKRWGALTPGYACMEMWSGISADPRDDVYSLGCIVYQVLCGRHPFLDENKQVKNAVQVYESGMRMPPIPGLSRRQNAALAHALALHRADRTPSAAQFLEEFNRKDPIFLWMAVAAAVLGAVAVGLWLTLKPLPTPAPPAPTPIHSAAVPETQAPAAVTAIPTPQPAPETRPAAAESPSATFARTCGMAPSAESLDRFVDIGLKSQSEFAFAGSNGARLEAAAAMRRTADCVRRLHSLGFESVQSRNWLSDATKALAGY